MEPRLKIETLNIKDIKPYRGNAKKHPPEQIEQIKRSIEEFGFDDPIAIWGEDNTIIEGHGRYIACKQLGIEEVPVIRLDHLTDEQRRAYTLIHNQLTLNSGFDIEMLNMELSQLPSFNMDFYGFEYDPENTGEEEAEDDLYDIEQEVETVVKQGDIWLLGTHRLMCGDSTDPEQVKLLMNGRKADLLFTDPPYNVNISNSQGMKIENDNMNNSQFLDFLKKAFLNACAELKKGGAFYIWHATTSALQFIQAAETSGLDIHQTLIWVKPHFTISWADYKWMYEPCLYGWKEGDKHYFTNSRCETTVIDYQKTEDLKVLKKEELLDWAIKAQKTLNEISTDILRFDKTLVNTDHPTMKPIPLCGYCIKNSSKAGEIVLDLFGGSGSTMMACEQLNRINYTMEYDPHYCDVIINRWETYTGQKAHKEGE